MIRSLIKDLIRKNDFRNHSRSHDINPISNTKMNIEFVGNDASGLSEAWPKNDFPARCRASIPGKRMIQAPGPWEHDRLLVILKEDGLRLKDCDKQSLKMCKVAVKQNGLALEYVRVPQTREMCVKAIKQNPDAYEFVKEKTEVLRMMALRLKERSQV